MADSEEQMIPTPSDFGHFLLERELGHGGMGGVYLARDKMLDREVAIKVMLKSLGEDPKFVERLQLEAQAAARLNHPNIAQIYSFGTEDGMPYIAMELVSGGSLDKVMAVEKAEIDVVRVMRIGQQMADALSTAADAGLVHGDVKPENVLFDMEGNAKLVDFGLAALQGDSSEIWGTPYYISPEKVRRQKIDYRADIYSLGATLYHALTGVPPFDGPDATATVKARFETAPKKPSELRAEIPAEVDSIIMRMLELEPAMRYPTYSSLIGDFKRYLAKAGPERKASVATGTKIKIKMRRPGSVSTIATGVTAMEVPAPVPELLDDGAAAQEEEEKHLGVGAIVGMAVGGIVLVVLLVVGGLMWYVKAEDAREKREHSAMIVAKQTQARDAIKNTLAAVKKFGENFHDLVGKAEKDVASAISELRPAIPDEIKEKAAAFLVSPPPTKDILEAIAYTNDLYVAAAAAEAAAQNQKAADEKAAAEAKQADTNATAKAAAPAAGTNAVAKAEAKPAGTNAVAKAAAPAAAATNAVAKAEAKAEAKPAAAEEESADSEDAEAKKDAPPAMEMPAAVKQFAEVWTDLCFCRASDIRVQARVALLLEEGAKAAAIAGDDVATTEKLAKFSRDLVESFDSIKGMKCVEQTQRKVSAIRMKSASLVKTALTQIQKEVKRMEKIARDKAEAEAKAAAEEKAAAEHKAKVEEEVARVQKKFDDDLVPRLKRLEWEAALRHVATLERDLTTSEAKAALRTAKMKVDYMKGLQTYFVEKSKGFEFKDGSKIADATAKKVSIQKYKRERFKKPAPVGKPHDFEWTRFYGRKEHLGEMNQMLNGLVLKGRETKNLGKLKWSQHMFGAALTLQLLYADVDGASDMAETFVKRAVKDFDDCRKTAERLFPEVKLEDAE